MVGLPQARQMMALRWYCLLIGLAWGSNVCDDVAALQISKVADFTTSGWSFGSSTQFGEGEAVWPNAGTGAYRNWYLNRINSRAGPWQGTRQSFSDGSSAIRAARVGAAIPWPTVMNYDFGGGTRGRKFWIEETIKQAQGVGGAEVPPLCYMVQPVNSFAYTESGEPVDFNDPSVLATSKDGEHYVYLVAPYEGCGGDGQDAMGINDCFNTCVKIQDATNVFGKSTDVWLSEMDQICSDPPTGCSALCSLWNGTAFEVPEVSEPNSGKPFVTAGSCMLGISYGTDYARNDVSESNAWVKENWGVDLDASKSCKGHWNYCSGSNGHFDLAVDPSGFGIPWLHDYNAKDLTNLAGDSTGQNIMLRWRAARCNEWGNWTPGLQDCAVKFCSQCVYDQPEVCEICLSGSELQPDGSCSDLPDTGKCSDLGLPEDNTWLKVYCRNSWSADGTHALPKGSCKDATTFCECLGVIQAWAKKDPEQSAVADYRAEHCTAAFTNLKSTSRIPPPPGLGAGGNPVSAYSSSDKMVRFEESTVACADPKWQPSSAGIWSFKQIAEAFMTYGAKTFYEPGTGPDPVTQCVGALVTAAGECQETTESLGIGCDAVKTGHSGVFQLDFLRSPSTATGDIVNPQIEKDGGIMNLCISGFGAGYITGAPFINEPQTVYSLEGDSFLTCARAATGHQPRNAAN